MDRIRDLDKYQKAVLLFLSALLVIFTVLYPLVSSRKGFEYMGELLQVAEDNGSMIYSGKVNGQQATFTVTEDKTVTFKYGNMSYGPYTAEVDPSATPEDMEFLTGVEIRNGDEVFFRGGVSRSDNGLVVYDEYGSFEGFDFIISSNGIVKDAYGNIIDQMEPSASTILTLMDGPELISKGDWQFWFYGLIVSIVTAVSILFADELFRWDLRFTIRDADRAEPSDWELGRRYISWTVCSVAALVIYIIGLVVL